MGGLRLSVAIIPGSMKDHLLFFESRNQQRPSNGTICAMMRSPLTFDQVKPGPLSNTCCLGLVEKGGLGVVIYRLELLFDQCELINVLNDH